jgi:MoxR-like ATPase
LKNKTGETDMSEEQMKLEAGQFKSDFETIKAEVGKVIVGQEAVVEAVLTALICGGNVLLEGVPGLGKTELVKTLSRVLDLDFNRIQFTPDLMPADIIGTNMIMTDADGNHGFEFKKGPIFTQLLLADEINRATPKTQSALLETMQEGSVTTSGTTYHMKQPYFVMATQNPLEQEGTYPLPEAQLDRFMFKVNVPFPKHSELNEIVTRTILKKEVEVDKILNSERIIELRRILHKVVVSDAILDYAVRVVLGTHPDSDMAPGEIKRFVKWGASPRASQALITASRVRALAEGRVHVSCDDINHFAEEVLQHRIILNYDGHAENIKIDELLKTLIAATPESV